MGKLQLSYTTKRPQLSSHLPYKGVLLLEGNKKSPKTKKEQNDDTTLELLERIFREGGVNGEGTVEVVK